MLVYKPAEKALRCCRQSISGRTVSVEVPALGCEQGRRRSRLMTLDAWRRWHDVQLDDLTNLTDAKDTSSGSMEARQYATRNDLKHLRQASSWCDRTDLRVCLSVCLSVCYHCNV